MTLPHSSKWFLDHRWIVCCFKVSSISVLFVNVYEVLLKNKRCLIFQLIVCKRNLLLLTVKLTFGPFYIKERRSILKRYGVIFTCLSCRAVHLESAASLDTNSFVNALRRFLARRGPIDQLRSDCGSNIIGARNEFQQALAEMHKKGKVRNYFLKHNCDWIDFKFNVPHASHMSGAWERQIRTVRNALEPLLLHSGSQLNDEDFRTFLTEVQCIINFASPKYREYL